MKRLFKTAKYCLLLLAALPALAQAPTYQVLLNWTAPSTNSDGSPITLALTYNVYSVPSGQDSGGTKLASALTATTDTITSGLSAGATYCYYVTAVAGGQESSPSNAACKTFPAAVPTAPTGLTAQ